MNMRWGCEYEDGGVHMREGGMNIEQGKVNFGIGVLAAHRSAHLPLLCFKTQRVSRNQGITVFFLFHNPKTRIVQ